jgi:delta-aminolevulinic acid dehydratase/porphobilinogen synthase
LFNIENNFNLGPIGTESYNPDGLVPRAIQAIKAKHPDVIVVTDVALDPYSSMVCTVHYDEQ